MEPLTWIALVAAAFVLAHLAVLGYLYRSRGTLGPEVAGRNASDAREGRHEGLADGGEIACQLCGTSNDASYRFCKQCVSELSESVEAVGPGRGTERLGSR